MILSKLEALVDSHRLLSDALQNLGAHIRQVDQTILRLEYGMQVTYNKVDELAMAFLQQNSAAAIQHTTSGTKATPGDASGARVRAARNEEENEFRVSNSRSGMQPFLIRPPARHPPSCSDVADARQRSCTNCRASD
jgi:hypothetical protein